MHCVQISGLRAYEWNPLTQRWEDEVGGNRLLLCECVVVVAHLCLLQSDSHDIEGLLTRDLMRLCSGIPSF